MRNSPCTPSTFPFVTLCPADSTRTSLITVCDRRGLKVRKLVAFLSWMALDGHHRAHLLVGGTGIKKRTGTAVDRRFRNHELIDRVTTERAVSRQAPSFDTARDQRPS